MAGSTWRESFRRRLSSLVIAAAAEAVAIAIVLSGPREPVWFSLRLPLLVLAIAIIAVASRWRRMIVLGRDELVMRALARTRRIPWPAVASVHPRTSRITIRKRNGRGFTFRTGADSFDVADAIDVALTAAGTDQMVAADPLMETDQMAAADHRVGPGQAMKAEPVQAGVVATPWLVLSGTTGVALLAAKGYESDPALMAGLLGFAGAACLVALSGCLADWVRARG